MVRAILDGRNTQTRRLDGFDAINKNPDDYQFLKMADFQGEPHAFFHQISTGDQVLVKFKKGKPSSRLWVKETWRPVQYQGGTGMYSGTISHQIEYRASRGNLLACKITQASDGTNYVGNPDGYLDLFSRTSFWGDEAHWKPSIFMPRWASRLTLEIVSVRVERLQEISELDSISEGIEVVHGSVCRWKSYHPANGWFEDPRNSYKTLWNSINGPGSWEKNPFVWVIEFKRV